MTLHEQAIEEIRRAPEELVAETLDFLRFLSSQAHQRDLDTAFATEEVLARDWATPEEDEAWKDL